MPCGEGNLTHVLLGSVSSRKYFRFAFKRGDEVPRFHYEVRAFSMVVCNSDLSDVELELTVVKGINYGVGNPKEIDTYCR